MFSTRMVEGGCVRVSDLLCEDSDVLVEGVGGAHVSSRHPGLAGSACGQLALLKDQSQQRKQRVTAGTTTTVRISPANSARKSAARGINAA